MLQKKSITIAGHRTSLALETIFWQALSKLAVQENTSIAQLIARIDHERAGAAKKIGLASAVRVWLFAHKLAQPTGL